MKILKKWKQDEAAGRILTDLLFPRRCPVCDRPVKPFGKDICDGCRNALVLIREPRCLKCGKQLQDPGAEYCYDCARRRHAYTKGRPYTAIPVSDRPFTVLSMRGAGNTRISWEEPLRKIWER